MPRELPGDDQLTEMDQLIRDLFVDVDRGGGGPGQVGFIATRSAHLQAASVRRLTVTLERSAAAADRSASQMWWLTAVILLFTMVAAAGTALQAFAGGRSAGWW